MPLREGEDGHAELYNTLYRSLQRPVRRRLLFNLLEHNPKDALLVPENVHVGETELDRLNLELIHHHLPLLEEAGLIRWDRESGRVHKGRNIAEIRGSLEAIRENDPLRNEE